MRLTLRQAITTLLVLIILGGAGIAIYYFQRQLKAPPPQKTYKIALIRNHNTLASNFKGLQEGLSRLGYKEGTNVDYVTLKPEVEKEFNKHSSSDAQVAFWKEHEQVFLEAKPDIIVTASTPLANYFSKRQLNIPVVFMDVGSVRNVVANLEKPEGNITGITGGIVEFVAKRIEILKEINPAFKKLIVSPDKNFPNYTPFMESVKKAAKSLGLEVIEIPSKDVDDFVARLPKIISKKNGDAFLFFAGPNNTPSEKERRKLIIDQLVKERIPSINQNMELGAVEGILASYGAYRFETGKELAFVVDQILKGKAVNEIPVVPPLKSVVLEINLKTAKDLGVTIPDSILQRANKVYNE